MSCFIWQPFYSIQAEWSDSDENGSLDIWTDLATGTTYSLSALDAISVDIDGDNATNSEELDYGSNPFVFDSDNDGLSDGDEIHLAIQQSNKAYSLTNWDSNSDGISDHDDYYENFVVNYNNAGAGHSYSDWDGDGLKNPFDTYPLDFYNNDQDQDLINDDVDPNINDSQNYSEYNSVSWGSDALGDYDSDSIYNYWDSLPYGPENGSNDSDSDGITNVDDPYPDDYSNYSSTNGMYWYADVLGDSDGDSLSNYLDAWPNDYSNGVDSGNEDSDGDYFTNAVDPAPWDYFNYSSFNGTTWYQDALGDIDGDGTNNFHDAWPNDANNGNSDPNNGNPPENPDSDYDGFWDSTDPFPWDATNYSSVNNITWYGDALYDNDWDGVLNYLDAWPNDSSNGQNSTDDDIDDDGIQNDLDPVPSDPENRSEYNQIAWGIYAIEDLDNDEVNNFYDTFPWNPYDNIPDFDGDGIPNISDPFPKDSSNFSLFNNTTWSEEALSDTDSDGIPNWRDEFPNTPLDSDLDGITDVIDVNPSINCQISAVNGIAWSFNDADFMAFDNQPSIFGPQDDADGDGIINIEDESPFKLSLGYNYEDGDGDGFSDPPPPGWDPVFVDSDSDGLADPFDPVSDSSPGFDGSLWLSAAHKYFGDSDFDGIRNHIDLSPNDPLNENWDLDQDGLSNDPNAYIKDPAPRDVTNTSFYNDQAWYSAALEDNDMDGINNFYDIRPYESDNYDSDGDGYLDLIDPSPNHADNTSPYNQLTWWSDLFGDEDEDGILNFFDPYPTTMDELADIDQDGIPLKRETILGTNPDDPDSDDDGLTDGEEYLIYGSSATDKFSISRQRGWGASYSDFELVDQTDTDNDTLPDRVEIFYGLNPTWSGDAHHDLDQNGVTNKIQYERGISLNVDLAKYDSDGDGLSDIFEDCFNNVLSRNNADDAVADPDGDGLLNIEESMLALRPDLSDSLPNATSLGDLLQLMLAVRYPGGGDPPTVDENENGIPDWADTLIVGPSAPDFYQFTRLHTNDLDGDDMPDAWEHQFGKWKYQTNGLKIRVNDASGDNDEDGVPNLWEYRLNTNPLAGDSNQDGTSDADEDEDSDGLTNLQEVNLGTDLRSFDTDGDGVSDGQEVIDGTDPCDAQSNVDSILGFGLRTSLQQ